MYRIIESSSSEIVLEWFVHLVSLWRSAFGVPRPRNLPPDVVLSDKLRSMISKGVYNRPTPSYNNDTQNNTSAVPSIVIVPGSGRV